MAIRVQILVRGVVQGVGFRPYIFSLARRRDLRGQVLNNATGVLIDVEGEKSAIEQFINEIEFNPPPLSQIESIERRDNLPLADYLEFRIVESEAAGRKFVPLSADTATCADCLRELFDPRDRRFRYPFINCTNCGPRFTIVKDVPYDRPLTTMAGFQMCAECEREYHDPANRRFHAQPNACPACGPQLILKTSGQAEAFGDEALVLAASLLKRGKILAIKGLGGYHLACSACDNEAVSRLRQRKQREDKPFALMTLDL